MSDYAVLVIPIGVPRSGKSTFYKIRFSDYRRVSPDEIRFKMLDSEKTKIYFEQTKEVNVWKEAYKQLEEELAKHNDVYFDATNITKLSRYPLVALGLKYGYEIYMIYLEAPLIEALKRDSKEERLVGDKVISRMYNQLEMPERYEYGTFEVMKFEELEKQYKEWKKCQIKNQSI